MDGYSRFVRFFKVLLPLAALALLSMLFLLSRSVDPIATIPFADNDMTARLRDQLITDPFYSSTSEKGDQIQVRAKTAIPGIGGKPAVATAMTAQFKSVKGSLITLRADTGRIDVGNDQTAFTGNVTIETSAGYLLETEHLNATLSGVSADTPGPVAGTGPVGQLNAGRMQITSKNETGNVHMLFKDGVKLIYDPKETERKP